MRLRLRALWAHVVTRLRLQPLLRRAEATLWHLLQRAAAFCLPAAEGVVGRLRLLSAAPKSVYRF